MRSAAVATAAGGAAGYPAGASAGAASAPSAAPAPTSAPERFIARREAARRYLADCGAFPVLLNPYAHAQRANEWAVCGWRGTYSDHDLIALAEEMGWEGGRGC